MASGTGGIAREDGESANLLRRQRAAVALEVAIHRRIVGDQSRFIELHREAEIQREVVFLHRVFVREQPAVRSVRKGRGPIRLPDGDLVRAPPGSVERCLDHLAVGAFETPGIVAVVVAVGREHAVVPVDFLLGERPRRDQALADVIERAAERAHLSIAERWTDGLRRQRRVIDPDLHQAQRIAAGLEHPRIRVADAEHADAVENGFCAAVPECVAIERRVDHGRSIAGLGASRIEAVDVEHLVGNRDSDVLVRARHRSHEPAQLHALRGDDVVIVAKNLRVARGRIRQLVQREVRGAQPVVDPHVDGQVGIVGSARIGLVDGTRIGAGAEVARTAGLDTVAAHLHVPEQGLTQSDGGAPISYIRVELGNLCGDAGISGFPDPDCCPGTVPASQRTSPRGGLIRAHGRDCQRPGPAPGRRS